MRPPCLPLAQVDSWGYLRRNKLSWLPVWCLVTSCADQHLKGRNQLPGEDGAAKHGVKVGYPLTA